MNVSTVLDVVSDHWLLVLLLLISVAICYSYYEPGGLPPGPMKFPVVGNMPQVNFLFPHKSFCEWNDKYGPICRIYMGSQLGILIADGEMLKSALSGSTGEITAGRPFNYIFNEIQGGSPHGIVNIDGDKWKEQRRFSLQVLRNFGVGRTLMEDKIQREVDTLVGGLEEQISLKDPAGVHIILALKYCVGNIITSLAFGKTFPLGDPEFDTYQRSIDDNFRHLGKAQLLTQFPILRYITPDGCNYQRIMKNADIVRKFLTTEIQSHWEQVKNSDDVTDFTHAYMQEMMKHQNDPNSFYTDLQLESVVGDIFVAGQETTVTTLGWGILFFLHHPEVQEKLQKEIGDKVGSVPKWSDRSQLPYTNATIAEIQRLADIAPVGLPHLTLAPVEIGGYQIPARTVIFPNLHAIHYDPNNFPHPTEFRPERFLDQDGNFVTKSETLLPFSVGKRVCLGESLARMELFMIITALIVKYTFLPVDPKNLPSLEPVFGFTLAPKPFKVILKPNGV